MVRLCGRIDLADPGGPGGDILKHFLELLRLGIDIDENGMLHFEQMKCPLHGSGDCPWEGVVCKPKLDTGLSPREMELVPLFAEGLQSQVIADRLHIAKFTVDNHRRNILAKLGKHSVTELAAWYYDHVKPQQ